MTIAVDLGRKATKNNKIKYVPYNVQSVQKEMQTMHTL